MTAPSAGVAEELRPRLDHAVAWLRERGHDVVVGECLDGRGVTSAPKTARAAELTAMLTDPTIAAVVPPWGGETGIDLLDQVDWDALAAHEPTWLVGFSDLSTLLLPLLLRSGWAGLHGANLMDTPYAPGPGVAHWLDVAGATAPVVQRDGGRWASGWDRWEDDPTVAERTLDREGGWSLLDPGVGPVDVTGRLVGGCLETVSLLAGTPWGDVAAFGRAHAEDGLVVYVEAAEWAAGDICRALHAVRLAGWFDHARAVLVGRTSAPDLARMTQREAVADALGDLGVPVVLDVGCGHVPPYLPLVNGALARVVVDGTGSGDRREVVQVWPWG